MAKPKGRGEQRRKSARILALEALKIKKQNEKDSTSRQQPLPPPPRRGRKKKRLDQVVVPSADVPATQQNDEDNPNHQVPPANNVFPPTQQMPERCILEFILDKLQKRDAHDLFVEPVDMDEVKGYRNVIKYPMDFSTMRAKLHEGMYTSLKQFEDDVFAICSNAMLFNSSTSIYSRQARAIDELAKRVFHTLETDPKRIELEFSLSRRQHGRKPQADTRGKRRAYHGSTGAANPHPDEILPPPGHKDGRKANFCVIGRRQTYNPQTSPFSENDSVISTLCSSKQLVPGNGGIGYKESLMRFVQDLGPSAQNVANWKLGFLNPQPPSHSIRDSLAAQKPTADAKGKSVLTADFLVPYNGGIGGKSSLVDFQSGAHTKALSRYHLAAAEKKNITPAFNTGFKFMDFLREDMREDHTPPCNQLPQNQPYSYLPAGPGTRIANGPSTWLRDNRGGNYQMQQPAHLASRSQAELLAFLYNRNRRPKSIVHPTKFIKPSSSGPDPNYGAGSAQMNPPLQWRNPPVPYDSRRMQPLHGGLDQYLQPQPSHVNTAGQGVLSLRPLVASAPYVQGQSSGANAPPQDEFSRQELQFTPTPQLAQPPRRLLNLLGGDLIAQPEPPQLPAVSYAPAPPDESSPLGGGGPYAPQGPQLSSSRYIQTESTDANSLSADAYLQQEPELPPLPCQLNLFQQQPQLPPLPRQLNLFSMHATLPPEGQLGMSGAGSFFQGASIQQNNINGQFWSFEQQSMRGTQPLDLALQLQTQIGRL